MGFEDQIWAESPAWLTGRHSFMLSPTRKIRKHLGILHAEAGWGQKGAVPFSLPSAQKEVAKPTPHCILSPWLVHLCPLPVP